MGVRVCALELWQRVSTHVRGTTLKYGPQWEQRQQDWEEQREQEQRRQEEEEEEVKDTTEGKGKWKGKEHSA